MRKNLKIFTSLISLMFITLLSCQNCLAKEFKQILESTDLTWVSGNQAVSLHNEENFKQQAIGNYVYSYGGGQIKINPTMDVQFTAGMQAHQLDQGDQFLHFQQFPVEVIPYYHLSKQNRIGFGPSYHLNPLMKVNGVASEFDNALGMTFKMDHRLSSNMSLGLRMTNISYNQVRSDIAVDGSHACLLLKARF